MGKLYILVDCQNDFISGSLGSKRAEEVRDNIVEYIKANDFTNSYTILTKDVHFDNYFDTQEGKRLPISHCISGSHGYNFDDKIIKELPHYSTHMKSTFGDPYLPTIVSELDFFLDEIIIMGFCTDICVISNALILKSSFPSIPISVIENCCAGTNLSGHKHALAVMRNCQINII